MKNGICKLCHEDKPLLNKSHIIPEFFYKQGGLYNEKLKINKIVVQNFIKDKKISYVSSGIYEGGILCSRCDNVVLGELETYGRKVLFGGLHGTEKNTKRNIKNNNVDYLKIDNVDYAKFKLFLLSILWRSAISTNNFFHDVSFSDEYIEILREMILNKNPGKINDFPIFTECYLKNKSVPKDGIGQPIKSEISGINLITFLLSGFVFMFYVTPDYPKMEIIKDFTPSPQNQFGINQLSEQQALDFMCKYMNIPINSFKIKR